MMALRDKINRLLEFSSPEKLEEAFYLLIKDKKARLSTSVFPLLILSSPSSDKLLYLEYHPLIGNYTSRGVQVPYYKEIRVFPLTETTFIASTTGNYGEFGTFIYDLVNQKLTILKYPETLSIISQFDKFDNKYYLFFGISLLRSKQIVELIKISRINLQKVTTSPLFSFEQDVEVLDIKQVFPNLFAITHLKHGRIAIHLYKREPKGTFYRWGGSFSYEILNMNKNHLKIIDPGSPYSTEVSENGSRRITINDDIKDINLITTKAYSLTDNVIAVFGSYKEKNVLAIKTINHNDYETQIIPDKKGSIVPIDSKSFLLIQENNIEIWVHTGVNYELKLTFPINSEYKKAFVLKKSLIAFLNYLTILIPIPKDLIVLSLQFFTLNEFQGRD